jgi:hypothetical protein
MHSAAAVLKIQQHGHNPQHPGANVSETVLRREEKLVSRYKKGQT